MRLFPCHRKSGSLTGEIVRMDAGLRLLPLRGYRRFLLRDERLIYPDGRGDCAELWRWESLREPHPALLCQRTNFLNRPGLTVILILQSRMENCSMVLTRGIRRGTPAKNFSSI